MAHRPRPRFHAVPVKIGTGADASFQKDFNLEAGTHLVHVSVNLGFDGPPLRIAVTVIQPRARASTEGSISHIMGGWVRGMARNPSHSHDLSWDGDIPIGTDMALRLAARNDTGDARTFKFFFEVV